MKHKHCELIKAWAEGAEIQYQNKVDGYWEDVYDNDPEWDASYEYRIKPEAREPVVRWLWANKDDDFNGYVMDSFYMTEEKAKELYSNPVRLEWSRMEFPE